MASSSPRGLCSSGMDSCVVNFVLGSSDSDRLKLLVIDCYHHVCLLVNLGPVLLCQFSSFQVLAYWMKWVLQVY